MERVAFLIEETGLRIGCLLNPESVVTRRTAGVRPRHSAGGQLSGTRLTDDPMLYTGGGRTELELDLVFDTTLAGSTVTSHDVRDLTRPMWELAENAAGRDGYGRPPVVRFVWGKAWNIPGVIEAVAERLEQFTPEGAPQRSWLRLRLVRVSLPTSATPGMDGPTPQLPTLADLPDMPPESLGVHQTSGAGESRPHEPTEKSFSPFLPPQDVSVGERLDELAARFYGNPALWRLLAAFNGLDDPARIPAGLLLQIPPPSALWGLA